MTRVSYSKRDSVLIAHGFQCCVCGVRYFCDLHHIMAKARGGTNDLRNLVVLCPSCHRAAHAGSLSVSAIRKARAKHLKSMERRKGEDDAVSLLQSLLVVHFVKKHCIDSKWRRAAYSRRSQTTIYAILVEFHRAGFVINPTDQRPLLVAKNELAELSALEAVTSYPRFLFLEELEKYTRGAPRRHFLVRGDVLNEAAVIEEGTRLVRTPGAEKELKAVVGAVRSNRLRISGLVRARWSPPMQDRVY